MNATNDNTVRIARLSLHSSTADAIARRLRAERLLDTTDLRPAGMPFGAVLIVRALQVRADLDTHRRSHPAAAQARRALEGYYHTAARPAHAPVPLSAQSVLFADEAELLVCLTRDLVAGQAAQRWYWRQSLSMLPPAPGAALAQAWAAHIPS
jgi:hypothetical protein